MFGRNKKETEQPLSDEDIVSACHAIAKIADKADVQHALIGGGLFRLLGLTSRKTFDLDFAATDYLDLPPAQLSKWSNMSTLGHYKLFVPKLNKTVHVDWMTRGNGGMKKLFEDCVKHAVLDQNGIWCAPKEWAMAIKLNAGRKQDLETFDEFIDNGVIDDKLVIDILRFYNPKWRRR